MKNLSKTLACNIILLSIIISFFLSSCKKEDSPLPVNSQSLKGSVTDDKGIPITNANVSLENSSNQYKSVTNYSGQFTFDDIQTGTYSLKIVADGYSSASSSVTIKSGDNSTVQPITMTPEVVRKNTTTIEGGPFTSKTEISYNINEGAASYDSKNGVYYAALAKSSYRASNNVSYEVVFAQFLGSNPTARYYSYDLSSIFAGLILTNKQTGSESIYVSISGSVTLTKFNKNGSVNGTFTCSMMDPDTYNSIEASGEFSVDYIASKSLGKNNNSQNNSINIDKMLKKFHK
jgi:hypothetical protein